MAKWVFDQWDNTMDYPTLGFVAEPGDILDAVYAPDARWSLNADQGAAETVERYATGSGSTYVEPTDGFVLTYDAAQNKNVPKAPADNALLEEYLSATYATRDIALTAPDLAAVALTVGVTLLPVEHFDGHLWGIEGTTLKNSADDGATWATVATMPAGSVSRIIPTDDGEIVLTNGANIWKSAGWTTNPATATYSVKVTKSAPAGTGIRPWGFDGDGTHFIATEYSGTDRTESRYVWTSTNAGTTWTVAYDDRTDDPTGALSHHHAVCADPWGQMFWRSNGHGTTHRGTYWAPYSNPTSWTKLGGAFQPDAAPTTLTATDDGIVCGSDSGDGGLYGIPRTDDPAQMTMRRTARWITPVDGVAGFAERGFRDPRTGIVYVSFKSDFATVSGGVAAGTARNGRFIWSDAAAVSRFPSVVVTPTGHLAGVIDRTGSYDRLDGELLAPASGSYDSGNVNGGESLNQTGVAIGPLAKVLAIARYAVAAGVGALAQNQGWTVFGYKAGATSPSGAFDVTAVGRETYGANNGSALGAGAQAGSNAVALGKDTVAGAANDAGIGARQLTRKRLSGDTHPAVPAADEVQDYTIQVGGRLTDYHQYRDGRRVQTGNIGILASVTGINGKSVATTNLLTVPSGSQAVITHVRIRLSTGTAVTGVPTVGVGIAAGEDDIMPATALTGLDTGGESWAFAPSGVQPYAGPGAVIKLGVDVAAVGTTYTMAVEVLGYLL